MKTEKTEKAEGDTQREALGSYGLASEARCRYLCECIRDAYAIAGIVQLWYGKRRPALSAAVIEQACDVMAAAGLVGLAASDAIHLHLSVTATDLGAGVSTRSGSGTGSGSGSAAGSQAHMHVLRELAR